MRYYRAMPESTPADSTPPVPAAKRPGVSGAKTTAAPGDSGLQKLTPVLTLAALALAVLAVVLAVVGWFRPSTGPGKFSDQEAQDAKGRVCEQIGTVRQAMGINTNLSNPVPGDPIGGLAVMANARLSLYGGGGFVLHTLDEEPATPAELNKAAAAMANTMQKLSINYMAGAPAEGEVQRPLRDDLGTQLAELDQLCQ